MVGAAPSPAGPLVKGGYAGVIAPIAAISVVGTAMGLSLPLLSVLMEERGTSATVIGFNVAVGGLAAVAISPLATGIARRFGVVASMVGSIIIAAASLLLFHLSDALWTWFPLRVFLAASLTMLFILSEFWINTAAPPGRRGLVLGIYATVLSLGFAAGPSIFAWTGSEGFLPFGIGIAICLSALIPCMAAGRHSPVIADRGSGKPFAGYIFLVPTATLAVLVFGAVETGGFALFPVYGPRSGFTDAETALLLAAIGLGNALLQIPIGIWSDRVSDRRLLLLLCALTGFAGTAILPALGGLFWPAFLTMFLWGGVISGLYTVGLAHLGSRLDGSDLASANAAFVFCYGIGMVAGPQIFGTAMDIIDPHGFVWSIAAFFAVYSAIVIFRMRMNRAA